MSLYDFSALINNQEIKSENNIKILNPDNLSVIGSVPALTKIQIENAFKVARVSQKEWTKKTLLERIKILTVWRNLIAENQKELATIMTKEIAKSSKESFVEVQRTLEYIDYTFEEAKRINPLALTGEEFGVQNKLGIFEHIAKGVGLAISPFNYPLNLAMSKIMPALVMGNTLVFKPATAGSLIGTKLGELAKKANLPKGVFNVVTGLGREIGDNLISNPEIDFISFTGSVEIGKNILNNAITKDIVLELGGKDPALVLDCSNLDKVADQIITGAFGYSGQRCTAIKRVIVTDEVADFLIPELIKKTQKLTVGHPEDNVDIVPLIDQKSADFVMSLISDAKNKGANVLIGGTNEKNLVYPTLVDCVQLGMDLAVEEPFGPVLPIIRVKDIEQMISIANDSKFGLQASIFGQDFNLAIKIAKRLEVGTININGKSQRGPDSFPFLGIKSSGFNVQGIRETLLSVTRYRGIVINY